ncbi:MAG: hypothetical protein K0U84_21745 [Actinomycetia bacterium]|nr:hypothetical protein [Actinomycetes bacterium]
MKNWQHYWKAILAFVGGGIEHIRRPPAVRPAVTRHRWGMGALVGEHHRHDLPGVLRTRERAQGCRASQSAPRRVRDDIFPGRPNRDDGMAI